MPRSERAAAMWRKQLRLIAATATLASMLAPASGQEEQSLNERLLLDLNSTQQTQTHCRLIFMVENRLEGDLENLSFETVIFDEDGAVERFALFDFRDVPVGRARVRQFDLPNAQCASIGHVLINGAGTCEGAQVQTSDCIDKLHTTSRVSVELSG